ncbi:MAG: acyltransferase, partial [Rhodoferax sp.]|nr:acyltransferase [Rhodoferax sp.]
MNEAAGQTSMRSDIQALRALAVSGVVACHMNPAWLPGGFLGVDVFFVVSGFVITRWLLVKQQGNNLLNFWLQRVLRIVPAYVVMLTVVTSGTAVIFLPENFQQFAKSWLYSLVFVSNRYFANYGDYFSPVLHEQPLLHTWSLAIEMQFYLVYPILFLMLRRTGQFWVLPALVVIGVMGAQWAWSSSQTPSALYYALLVRAPEFLLGCSLAVFRVDSVPYRQQWVGSVSTAVGLALILASFGLASERWFNPVIAAAACAGAGLVIWGRSQDDWFGNLFASRWVLWLGALSYSIYLWHWPVLALARYAYGTLHWDFQLVVVYVAVVLGLSWGSWNWIENRFRARDVRNRSAFYGKLGAIGLVAISPLAYASHLNSRVPELPVELTRYAVDDTICHGKLLPACVRGPGPARFLMIGDSHAAQLNVAADVAGHGLNMG